MLVREVMTAPAITVRDQATVKEATVLLDRYEIAAMPVVDASGELVGVVSEADVIREMVIPDPRVHEIPVRLTRSPFLARVCDVMSTHALTVPSHAELALAAELMTSNVVKSLPVVDRGRVVGVVSRRDIIRLLARNDSRIEAEIDELFRQAERDWLVKVEDGVAIVEGPFGEDERSLAETLVSTVPGIVGIHVRHVATW